MRRRALSAVAGILAVAASVAALAGSASAAGTGLAVAYQVDVAHDGVQNDSTLNPPFNRRWQATFPGALSSYPLIAGGMVYVTVSHESVGPATLYALDQRTGQVVWSRTVSSFPWANAAYDAGRVFVVEYTGLLQAFAADTGTPQWSTQLPGQYSFSSPPTASNGVVYTGGAGSGGTVYAVDEATGAVLATQSVQNGDNSSPALSPTSVFVSYACNQAYGFAQPDLAFLWHYSTFCAGGGGKTAVYAGGRVYTRDFFGNLVLDAASGTLVRSYTPDNTTIPAPAVDASTIFALTQGALTAQSAADGSVRWSFSGDGRLVTAPIAIATSRGEFVVEGSASGMLYALDATTGRVAWKTNAGSPIAGPDEQNVSQPLTGLGAGQGLLVVPAGSTLTAYSGHGR
jgi:outer membrane protein assembly factor BamB